MEYNSIFKRYDIRGKYPEDINECVVGKIALAYMDVIKPNGVVLGHDNIDGSDKISNKLSEILRFNGVEVYEAGLVTSPMLYFSSSVNNIPISIMCTASHLGEGHTGIKPNKGGIPLEESEIVAIKKRYEEILSSEYSLLATTGRVASSPTYLMVYDDYTDALLSIISGPLDRYTVVADLGNGVNSLVSNKLFARVGLKFTLINTDIRGKDLSHPSNPKIKQNRAQLELKVKEERADIGIIWDGDCDRGYFIDSLGDVIPPEYVAICIARLLKETKEYSKITADVRASFAVEKECFKYGIEVKRIKAWHVPIKYEMENDAGIGFGFEVSGHYVFKDFYKIDDGMLAALMFINALQKLNIDLKSDLKKFRETYYILEEINYSNEASEEALQKILSKKYESGKITLVDGISVDFPTWRFNVRSSRTEPIIRLNISGTDRAEVDKNLKEIETIIGGKKLAS
jgi:phosphomannomutase